MRAEYPPRQFCHTEKCPSSWDHSIGPLGLIPLGRLHMRPLKQHFHSLGLTNQFTPPCGSDPLVLATLLRTPAPHQCAGAQGGNFGPPTPGLSITGPPCYDHYRQPHCCSLYQQTGWDPFPCPGAAGGRSVSVATDSGHNPLGQTHSVLPQCDSRPFISAEVIQKLRMTREGEVILIAPLVAVTTVVSIHTTSVCGPPSIFFVPPIPTVTTGICLERQVVPSAHMEALMQHYQAAGFSRDVSRLAAAPRRPSTNRMYDDRWLRFAYWATGQGFDPLGPTAAQIAVFWY